MLNYNIKSKYDNVNLNINKYECDNPKAIVLIVHGMCEYKERYDDFCKMLNNNGYLVYSYDHRGHGKSVNENGYGYFSKKHGHIAIVEDLKSVITHIKVENPGEKLYLFAHSMGTIVTRLYLQTDSKCINNLILCGAPNYRSESKFGVFLASCIKFFQGDKKSSKLLTKLSVGSFNNSVENPISKNNWISYNEENVKKYDNDKLCNFTFTNSAYKDLFTMLSNIGSPKKYTNINNNLPIKFIAGEDDPCTGGTKGLNSSIGILVKAGFINIDKYEFPHMRHEILNETDKESVYNLVLKFYDEVL